MPGPWKEEERAVTGAADGFLRMVPVQLYHGGILLAQIPCHVSLMNNIDQFLDFFTAEIGFNIQESICLFPA